MSAKSRKSVCWAWIMILCALSSSPLLGQVFIETNRVEIDYGGIWCIPVFDGENIVVSTESNRAIKVAKFDLDLNKLTGETTVATTNDTAANDGIADHKHIFQNGYHYITFSTSGSGGGGYMYLLKLDTNFNREGLVAVVTNDPPTNDMMMGGDGTYIYPAKFFPGIGHLAFRYDTNLNFIESWPIGGFTPSNDNRHANGAAVTFYNGVFHQAAPENVGPGSNSRFFRLAYDTNWNVQLNREAILTDTNVLSLVTGLSVETNTENFIVHYTRTGTETGGPVYRALYDAEWGFIENKKVIDGTWHRPHSLIVSNTMYVGYDDLASGVFVTAYAILDKEPIDSGQLVWYDFQDSTGTFELVAEDFTNLVTTSPFDTWDGTPDDTQGDPSIPSNRAVGNTLWNVTNLTSFFHFTITVSNDYEMLVTQLLFDDKASPTGPTNWQFRFSGDNYALMMASGPTHASSWTTNTVHVGLPPMEGSNTFRMYGQHASDAGGTWRIDNVYLRGQIRRSPNADDDGDGIANGYEEQFTGTTTGLIAQADNDLDGSNNLDEYLADTLALGENDYFSLRVMTNTAAGATVSFTFSPKRMYVPLFSTNPAAGWTTLQTVFDITNSTMSFTDTNGAPYRSYGVRVHVP